MHLLAAISAHGLGHLGQSAPVLNALRRAARACMTVASTLPEVRLRQRIDGDFHIEARALDLGFVMHDAFRVDLQSSADAYRALHADWPRRVDETVAWLQALRPTLLLCNAAYLPLAAASRLGLPAFGMSSLNWADLFAHVFDGEPWAAAIHAQMLEAYRAATLFIKLTPGMDMPSLPRSAWAGPVAMRGRERREELRARPVPRPTSAGAGGLRRHRYAPAAGTLAFPGRAALLLPQAWGAAHRVPRPSKRWTGRSATCWPRPMR